ncbi:hypothetical protein D3C76_1199370 [compost metagenome]
MFRRSTVGFAVEPSFMRNTNTPSGLAFCSRRPPTLPSASSKVVFWLGRSFRPGSLTAPMATKRWRARSTTTSELGRSTMLLPASTFS